MSSSQLTPLIAVHASAALIAVVLGPFALWARLLGKPRVKLHRAFGYAWVTMMLVTALTALGIRNQPTGLPQWQGFSPIHLLIFVTIASLFFSFKALVQGNIKRHRYGMISLYVNACLITGVLTLLPGRAMHRILFN